MMLSSNFLTSIEENAITNLPSLTTVDLAFNQLRALATDSLSEVGNIRSLSLQGNPLECACCAVWLYKFIQDNNLNSPLCENPEEFRELALLSLMMEQLCDMPTAAISGTSSVVIEAGNSLQLECTTTGSPLPDITWSRDGMTFDSNDSRIRVHDMTLIIVDVKESDSGMYYCIATSSAGQVSVAVPVNVLNVTGSVNEVQAIRGENVMLSCVVDMRDLDSPLTWIFNSSALELSDKYTIIEGGSLLIRDVGLNDMGEYTCQVADIQILHSLVVSAAPTFTIFPEGSCENPSLLMIDSDQNFDLVCAAFGIPPPTVSWFNKGDRLNQTVPLVQTVGGVTDVTWNLFRPRPSGMSGNYTCVATSSLGTIQRTVKVDIRLVLQPGTNPTLDVVFFVGDTAVLECGPGERIIPGSVITWKTRSGFPLPLERIVFASNNATLVIKNLTLPNDRDGFECTVQRPDGLRSKMITDIVLDEPPMISKDCAVPVVTALVGEKVTLPCFTRGTPDPLYEWFVNGSLLMESAIFNRSTVEIIGQRLNRNFGVRLNITSAQESDSGVYNCTAFRTIAGEQFRDSYIVELQIQRLPYFTYQPGNTAVVSGTTATLLCGGRGSPTPSVTWFFQPGSSTVNSVVMPDLRHVITSHALLIQNVQPNDEGVYFCEISSPLQTRTSAVAFLRVYTTPQLGSLRSEITVPTGSQSVTLDCFGSGDPVPDIHWLKQDTILPISGEHVLLDNGSLVLLSVEPSDRGEYVCRLANVAGMVYHTVTLNVQTLPNTIVQPSVVRANVGCQVTLRCSDAGQRPSDISEIDWIHQGQVLVSEEGRVNILTEGELVLSDLVVADSGNYTCRLWTALGFVEKAALVIVEDPIFATGAPVSVPTLTTSTPLTQTLHLLTTAQFVCFAEGFPPPTIVWLRNGVPQPRFSRVTINNGGLTISQLRVTDNATYTCVATNALGEDSIDFQLILSAAPNFNVRPLTQTILLGDILTFNCSASGTPPPVITWLHNDSIVVTDNEKVFIDPQTNRLTVNQAAREDGGVYSCVARNNAGIAEFSVPVTVQDIMIPPNITVPPESVMTEAGLNIVLDCIATAFPQPSVSWLKDGVPVVPCTNQLQSMGELCVADDSIFILSAEEDDSGRYTCTAQNSAGIAVYEVFVTVETRLSIPVFEVYPIPAWLGNGSQLQLDCQANGSPSPTISWLKDFQPINVSDTTCSNTNGHIAVCSNGSLIIEKVLLEDTGFYTCVASNEAGANQVSIAVDVSIAMDVDSINVTGPLTSPTLTSTPTVLIQQSQGVDVTLNCTAEGNPLPVVSWLRERAPIDFNIHNNTQQLPNGSLLLTSAMDGNAGEYTCLARNSQGTAEVTFVLDFVGRRQKATGNEERPVIVVPPGNRDVTVGSEVTVDCKAKGHPEPDILWEHNNILVQESKFMHIGCNGSLMISSAQTSHTGNYSCTARNKMGSDRTAMKLHVKAPREVPPLFKESVGDVDVLVGGHLVLQCEVLSVEGGDVSRHWFRDEVDTSALPNHNVFCDGTTLLVSEFSRPGSVEYRCVASSMYGNSTSYRTVRVTDLHIDENVYCELGDAVYMTCDSGVWKREGKTLTSNQNTLVEGRVLFILQSSIPDEGEYTCVSGTSLFNYYLQITSAPKIVESAPIINALSGKSLVLRCVAIGRPRPLIVWYKGSMSAPLVSNDQLIILTNGSLVLHEVSRESGGVYTCKAQSRAGEAKATTLVVVE